MSTSSPGPEVTNPDADGLVGGITMWPSHVLPGSKYRWADGSLMVRADFSLCFSRLGTEHNTGGEAGTDFRLPNYTGKFPVGYDSADVDFDGVGDTGGSKSGSVSGTTGAGSSHSHGAGSYGVTTTATGADGAAVAAFASSGTQAVSGTSGTESSHTHSFSGSAATVPPFRVTRFIIKVM